jgi:ABC-type cobalamin/Fe3+-siderophores transport systems, ATPase components
MTLSARQLTIAFGDRVILDHLDLDLREGMVTGLIGPNGAGKTTLLRAIAGVIPIRSGTVNVYGRAIVEWRRQALARTLAYLPQGAACTWPMTVRRVVALGRLPHLAPWRGTSAEDEQAIDAALAATDVLPLAQRSVLTLSGGERARVMLARALAVSPRYLLADEPVAGLDPEHQLRVMAQLWDRAATGAGIVVTLHDLSLAARFCDRLIVLDHGRIAADGPPRAVLIPSVLAAVFGVSAVCGSRKGQNYVVPWNVVPRLYGVRSEPESGGCHD